MAMTLEQLRQDFDRRLDTHRDIQTGLECRISRLEKLERDVNILKGLERLRDQSDARRGEEVKFFTPLGAMSISEMYDMLCKAKAELAMSKRSYDKLVASAKQFHIVVQGGEFTVEPREEAPREEAQDVSWKGLDIAARGVKR